MTLIDFLFLLIVAGICGSIGQSIAGYTRTGCLGSIALGFIGALLGGWIAKTMGLPEFIKLDVGSNTFPIIWSIAGSAIFVAIISFATRPRRRL